MFNKDFYPTPSEIARKMLAPYVDRIKAGAMILDPSAGKGNLLDEARYMGAKPANLFAVEIETELCHILTGKNYRVISNDFLKYSSRYLFDIVVMNPPFSNGEDHLLAAWEILRDGDIVCLLNAATLTNLNSRKRELLARIIAEHGSMEILGPVFSHSERGTGVNVVMVRLSKRSESPLLTFDFKKGNERPPDLGSDDTIDLDNQVAVSDLISALVNSYNEVGPAYADYIKARNRLEFYLGSIKPSYCHVKDTAKDARAACAGDARQKDMAEYNSYLDFVKAAAWQTVFDRTKLRAVLSSKAREDFDAFQRSQGGIEFTVENIQSLFEMLFVNRAQIMGKVVVEVFDKMCSYNEKNTIHTEGWKTNSSWKVNQKVIMPWFIEYVCYRGCTNGHFSIRYQRYNEIDDIDRAMCLITGKKFEDILNIRDALDKRFKQMRYPELDETFKGVAFSEFFEIRFWKKGTCHFIFRDKKVWEQFNRRAAQGKGWIGDGI
jgi:predicted RNA methylase